MTLPTQTAYFPFAQGPDTKTDPKQVVAGKLLKLQNGFFQTPTMIRKRYGFNALAQSIANGGGSIATGQNLAPFQSELTLADGGNLYTYGSSLSSWISRGAFTPCQVASASIFHDQFQEWAPTSAYSSSSGLYCYAWERQGSTNSVLYCVVDGKTGQAIVPATVADSSGVAPKVFLLGSNFLVVWANSGTLKYLQIPVSSPYPGSHTPQTITSDLSGVAGWEGAIINGRLFLAYNVSTGIGLRYITSALSVSAETTVTGAHIASAASISSDASNNVYVACYSGAGVQGFVYDFSLTTPVLGVTNLSGAHTITRIGSVNVGALTYTYWEATQSNTYDSYIMYSVWNSSGSLSTDNVLIRSVGLSSKPFVYNGTTYLLGNYYSSLQPTYFLLSINTGVATVTAKIASGAGALGSRPQLTEAQQVSAGVYEFALQEVDQVEASGPADFQSASTGYKWGVSSSTVTFGSGAPAVEIGNNLHIPGGLLLAYDGTNLVEQNFHVYPEQSPTPTITTTGGSIGAGQYQYCALYEWVDGQGQLHRSAPSIPVTLATTGSTNQVEVKIPTLRVTSKSGVMIGLYRTAADGTIFYRVNNVGDYIYNDPTQDSVTYTDIFSDDTVRGNNQLYTTGGEVENAALPAASVIVNFKNRLFALLSETPNQLWHSKEVIPGSPVEFSAFLTVNVDPKGGAPTALAQMDDKLLILKTGGYFILTGDGPAPSGLNSAYGSPEFVSSDSGALSQASVVSTPVGVFYQGAKGICLIDRSLEWKYIGAPMEGYVQGNTVTSAVLYESYNQVRFTLSSGIAVVFDYLVGQWSVYTDTSAVSACVFEGAYCYLTSGGQVLKESTSTFTDNGTFYPLLIQTSWLQFAGQQGFQRVREMEVLGDWKSAHTLQVQVAYDFNPAVMQTILANAKTSSIPYQYCVKFQRQKCQAMQLTIQDVQSPAYGEGMDLSGLAFEFAPKTGLNPKSNAQTYG